MTEDQTKIWNYLKDNAVGKKNAIHIKNMANALKFPPKGSNNDDVRALIKSMVVKEKKPIGTCEDGVYIFTNDKERENAAQFLERKNAATIIRTIELYNNE